MLILGQYGIQLCKSEYQYNTQLIYFRVNSNKCCITIQLHYDVRRQGRGGKKTDRIHTVEYNTLVMNECSNEKHILPLFPRLRREREGER